MTNISNLSVEEKPLVLLFAEPDALGISLAENLLANFCQVRVVTKEKSEWSKNYEHLLGNKNFAVSDFSKEEDFIAEYFVFVNTRATKTLGEEKHILDIAQKTRTKTLVILPYAVVGKEQEDLVSQTRSLVKNNSDFGVIFVGDVFGTRMDISGSGPVARLLAAISKGRAIDAPSKEVAIYPVFASDVAKEIVRSLFSFGPFGEELSLISGPVMLGEIAEKITALFPQIKLGPPEDYPVRIEVGASQRRIVKTNVDFVLKEAVGWLLKNRRVDQKQPFVPISLQNKPSSKKAAFLVGVFLALVLLSPLVSMAVGAASLFVAGKAAGNGKLSLTKNFFLASDAASSFSSWGLSFFSKPPLIGRPFSYILEGSLVITKASRIGVEGLGVIEKGRALAGKILGKEIYDPRAMSREISLDLDSIYKDTGFLQGEIEGLSGPLGQVARKYFSQIDIAGMREKVLLAENLSSQMSVLLGEGGPKTYLVLFQNNMELRPTGGFIGSYALVTFDGGRLLDINVSDVYSADGQLKGHVEPPPVIKKHLGEANWYLRDSNWDPDFPTSAGRAEWFLDKETDKSVDGVVGVDLEVAKSLLKTVGPVFLSDFSETIDYKNLYEKTQSEVEANFFPGSTKKASFLTALTRELLNKVSGAPQKDYPAIAAAMLGLLEEKHIQIFLHNKIAQKAVSDFGFDGGVLTPQCIDNCYSDFVGVVDANLGVNKANYFIKRSMRIDIALDGGQARRKLTVSYENTANPALGATVRYKTYTRTIIPQDAVVSAAEITSLGETAPAEPGIEEIRGKKEVGVLLEVGPGQTKTVVFSWAGDAPLSFDKEGEYRFYWRKQAGTLEDAISVNISTPPSSLTKEGGSVYNTNLTRDFFSRISWK